LNHIPYGWLPNSEAKLTTSIEIIIFLRGQPGGKPIKKRKDVSGGRLVVEILTPQSISSNTQYVTPSLQSFDELRE
jgi:hypothetical protein